MGQIIYDEKTMLNFKNTIEKCNSEIIDAIEKIQNELITMDKTLNTPKANKTMSFFKEQVSKDLNYVKNKKESYRSSLGAINSAYHIYSNSVQKSIGGW